MTYRKSQRADATNWGHEATKVESWRVQLAAKNGTFFAKIAGTNVLYSGNMEQVAKGLAGYDKTFSRSYTVLPFQVTVPHSSKPIKGAKEATLEDAARLEALVEQARSSGQLGSMRREEPEEAWQRNLRRDSSTET